MYIYILCIFIDWLISILLSIYLFVDIVPSNFQTAYTMHSKRWNKFQWQFQSSQPDQYTCFKVYWCATVFWKILVTCQPKRLWSFQIFERPWSKESVDIEEYSPMFCVIGKPVSAKARCDRALDLHTSPRKVAASTTLRCLFSISGRGSVLMLLGRISSASKNSFSNWNLIRSGEYNRTYEVWDYVVSLSARLLAVVPCCCGIFFHQWGRQVWHQGFFASCNQIRLSSYTQCFVSSIECKKIPVMSHTSLLGWTSCPWLRTSIFAPQKKNPISITVNLQLGAKEIYVSLLDIELTWCWKTLYHLFLLLRKVLHLRYTNQYHWPDT